MGVQSPDGKAAYVQVNLAGNQGTTLAQESVAAVRQIIKQTPPPPGVEVHLTGPAALIPDMVRAGNDSLLKMTLIAGAIIFVVLLFVYRSVATVILVVIGVGVEVGSARGIVAFLGDNNMVALSTFAINLLVALSMAAGTDYGIFFFGRYQEARQAGEDRETAYYTTYRGVAPVVLGSGLTIAGAMLCLSFTRMPIFQTIGVPCAVGMLDRGSGRAHAGSGSSGPRKSLRAMRPETQDRRNVDGEGSAQRLSAGPRPFSPRH